TIGGATSQPQIGAGQPPQEQSTPTVTPTDAAAAQATTPPDSPTSTPAAVATQASEGTVAEEGTSEAAGATAIVEPIPDLDGEAVLEEIRNTVEGDEPEFGPFSGEVSQSVGSIDIDSAGVSVENFYTTVRFTNPASPDAPDHPWDVLIGFWHGGGDDQIRVVVASDGTWSAAQGTARPTVSGDATSVQLGPARGNVIELAVVDGTGYLAINGEFVEAFAVPGSPQPGDIWIASGTFPENVQPGIETLFSDWTVWSLDSEPAG
ncbi:MAG: hypothetical protein AB7G88_09080, partial [Thermomicrobiales bacterium]